MYVENLDTVYIRDGIHTIITDESGRKVFLYNHHCLQWHHSQKARARARFMDTIGYFLTVIDYRPELYYSGECQPVIQELVDQILTKGSDEVDYRHYNDDEYQLSIKKTVLAMQTLHSKDFPDNFDEPYRYIKKEI